MVHEKTARRPESRHGAVWQTGASSVGSSPFYRVREEITGVPGRPERGGARRRGRESQRRIPRGKRKACRRREKKLSGRPFRCILPCIWFIRWKWGASRRKRRLRSRSPRRRSPAPGWQASHRPCETYFRPYQKGNSSLSWAALPFLAVPAHAASHSGAPKDGAKKREFFRTIAG